MRLTALLSMVIDHAALLFIRYGILMTLPAGSESYVMWNAIYAGMRTIGRMAFPIFAILLVQGYERTRNFRNYALRLFLLALVSELPFDCVTTGRFGINLTYQNTVYTLLIALLTIKAAESANLYIQRKSRNGTGTKGLPSASYFLVWAAAAIAGCLAAYIIESDYNWEGVAFILLLYLCRHDKLQQCFVGAFWSMMMFVSFRLPYILGYMAVFVFLYFWRDRPPLIPQLREKGGIALRWAEYLFYPIHFIILWGIYYICFLK